jgi:hypothetical protein
MAKKKSATKKACEHGVNKKNGRCLLNKRAKRKKS